MKLYGVAIAAVPQKNDANVINVICTPISVTKGSNNFYPLYYLAFKTQFNFTSKKEVLDCYAKVAAVIESTVMLQQQSLAEHDSAYWRPVALKIGEDSRRPVHKDGLFVHLFGKRLNPPLNEAELEMAEYNAIRKIRGEPPFSNLMQMTDECRHELEVFKRRGNSSFGIAARRVIAENGILEKGIAAAENADTDFLAKNSFYPRDVMQAYAKLSKTLDLCTLSWGSFTPATIVEGYENKQQNQLDLQLIELKESFTKGDENARSRLVTLAEDQGRKWGGIVSENSKYFQLTAPIAGYRNNKELQDKYPEYSFMHWDEDFRHAFYNGFAETYEYANDRHVKLFLDPPSPPFTDPCADMIRTQFQIIDGQRAPGDIKDEKRWREKITTSSKEVADVISPQVMSKQGEQPSKLWQERTVDRKPRILE